MRGWGASPLGFEETLGLLVHLLPLTEAEMQLGRGCPPALTREVSEAREAQVPSPPRARSSLDMAVVRGRRSEETCRGSAGRPRRRWSDSAGPPSARQEGPTGDLSTLARSLPQAWPIPAPRSLQGRESALGPSEEASKAACGWEGQLLSSRPQPPAPPPCRLLGSSLSECPGVLASRLFSGLGFLEPTTGGRRPRRAAVPF